MALPFTPGGGDWRRWALNHPLHHPTPATAVSFLLQYMSVALLLLLWYAAVVAVGVATGEIATDV